MDEQILVQILEQACEDFQLVFQVVEQEGQLHVFLNRQPDQVLDYRRVGRQIYTALNRLTLTGIRGVCLYSRVLGHEEPDWEGKFNLSPEAQVRNRVVEGEAIAAQTSTEALLAATYVLPDATEQRAQARSQIQAQAQATVTQRETAPPAAAAAYPLSDPAGATEAAALYEEAVPTVSVVADAPALSKDFDLSSYCFTRNRRLLTADLVPPSKAVARQVDAFHQFDLAAKQQLVPQLELFFKGAPTFCTDGLTEAMQQWFRDTEALGNEEMRKASIWVSRYCSDPAATLAVLARVLDPSLAIAPKKAEAETQGNAIAPPLADGAEAPAAGHSPAALSITPQVRQSRPSTAQPGLANPPLAAPQSKPKPPFPSWLFPSIVVFGSILLMSLGMQLAKPSLADAALCRDSVSPEQCQLAQQILFEAKTWEEIQVEAVPIRYDGEEREIVMGTAAASCYPQAAINGGYDLIKAYNNEIAPLSWSSSEILPGIVLVDIEYQNNDGPGTVRTACVTVNQTSGDRDWPEPTYLADAVIPSDWPTTAYDNSEDQAAVQRAAQATHPLVNFGSLLLFTTVGLFVAALLRMAVTAHSINVLCQAAVVMTIFEAIIELILPFGGILLFPVIIAKKSFALGLTGAVVPGFRVDWSQGYASVAGCVATMALVRFVLRGIMMLTILGGSPF